MDPMPEYENYDGLGLAALVRDKQVKPAELVKAAIYRAEKLNPALNAIVTPAYERAIEYAGKELPDGPFSGVPFLLKDLLAAWKGVRMTSGSRAYKDYVPDYDSELVRRFRRSGSVFLGKTNTPEFGLMGVTEPELHGPARNPWDLSRTPGGSSGGSAAAVASGIVPLASGGDGGGSIRIPSAYCGLFGLKPTRFRTPTGPTKGRIWHGAAVEHVLSRSVRDCAAMLDAVQGADCGAPFVIHPPQIPYIEETARGPGVLKVAFCTESPLGTEVDPECKAAVEDAARLMEEMGHKVEEAKPELDGIALAQSYFVLYFGEVAADIKEAARDIGRAPGRKDFETSTWFFGELGKYYNAREFTEAIRSWDKAARVMGEFHENYGLYLTPVTAAPPAKIGELLPGGVEEAAMTVINVLKLGRLAKATGMVQKLALDILARTPFTQLANFTGQPAMSLPLHEHDSGLPCGVQVTAPFGDEALLFRVAAELEKARPWFHKRPPLGADQDLPRR